MMECQKLIPSTVQVVDKTTMELENQFRVQVVEQKDDEKRNGFKVVEQKNEKMREMNLK
jgi:hypothetical protein